MQTYFEKVFQILPAKWSESNQGPLQNSYNVYHSRSKEIAHGVDSLSQFSSHSTYKYSEFLIAFVNSRSKWILSSTQNIGKTTSGIVFMISISGIGFTSRENCNRLSAHNGVPVNCYEFKQFHCFSLRGHKWWLTASNRILMPCSDSFGLRPDSMPDKSCSAIKKCGNDAYIGIYWIENAIFEIEVATCSKFTWKQRVSSSYAATSEKIECSLWRACIFITTKTRFDIVGGR